MWSLDSSLGFLMTRTARSMKRALDAKLVEHSLTSTQYIVLARLWEEDGISLTELGDRLYLDSPTITGIADRMERDGILERRRDSSDRRVVKVFLTAAGKALHQTLGHIAHEIDNFALNDLSAIKQRELLDTLNNVWKKTSGILD